MKLEKQKQQKATETNRFLLLLCIIIAASFFTRIAFLNAGVFHFDEVTLINALEKTQANGHIQPMAGFRYGTVVVNYAIFSTLRFFNPVVSAAWAVRFSAALFGTLSVLMLILLARKMYG